LKKINNGLYLANQYALIIMSKRDTIAGVLMKEFWVL